jgi:hypothetical protein
VFADGVRRFALHASARISCAVLVVVGTHDGDVVDEAGRSAAQRLYDAATSWAENPHHRLGELITAAVYALVNGLDSPALRELAGASATDSSYDIWPLLTATLDEVHTPHPGTLPPGRTVGVSGLPRRPAADELALAVSPATLEAGGRFQVQVYVNGAEITSAGAGQRMDPYDLLVPTNRLTATTEPHTVGIARCTCGAHGCGSTAVTIVRDDDRVHWEWSIEKPMPRGVTFPTHAYDAEVARVAADHSWETPDRTAGGLILTGLDREHLLSYGLRPSWVANHHANPDTFVVCLQIADDYQIFLHTPVARPQP